MELIKKVKQAEQQAQQIIEDAKAESTRQAEQGREHRHQLMEEAEQNRKKTISEAVNQAEVQARQEAESLRAQAEKQRQELHNKVGSKIGGATAKVMDYLQGKTQVPKVSSSA